MVDSRTPRSDGCGAPGAGARTTRSADTPISAFSLRETNSHVAGGALERVFDARVERLRRTRVEGRCCVWAGGLRLRASARACRGVCGAPFSPVGAKKITATRKIARIILTRASRANDARRFEPRARASRRIQTRTRALPSCARRRRRVSRARRSVARRIPALLLLRSLWMRRRPPRRPLPRA